MIRPSRWTAFGVGLVFVGLTSSSARAQDAGAGAARGEVAEDLTTLEASLAAETDALTTSDCANACRALASIRRAADKICALDAGDRCAAGRAKADDATRRVREACPECAIASMAPTTPDEGRAMTKSNSRSAPVSSESAAPAPPSESRRGGCAGCTTATTSASDAAGALLGLLAVAFATRRRRARDRRDRS